MDKDNFFTITSKKRVEEVNILLKKYELKEVAERIGIPYSTFTKQMRIGDYFYHQTDKQYYPFVRSESERVRVEENNHADEIEFIKRNMEVLSNLIQSFQSNSLLLLDEQVYSKKANYENKNIKMNKDIYKSFSTFCELQYPHFKMQDLTAQALLDFMNKYQK